jgi:putative MATE family efflux protein
MKTENKKFTRTLVVLAIPIVIQEILNSSVNLIDSFMIGSLGLNSINAVGFANQIFFLFIVATFGINSGSSIFMGQYWGKRDAKNVRKVMGIAMCLTLTIALMFVCVAEIIPQALLRLYTNEKEVIEIGTRYLRIVAPTYFLAAVSSTINIALKSCGQTRLPTITTFFSLITNASLNLLFIFVLDWNVEGAALATVTARTIECILVITFAYRLKTPVAGQLSDYLSADKAFIKNFAKIVSPVFANECFWAVGTSIYTMAYKFSGNEAQGAQQIANNVYNIFTVFAMAVGSAGGIMIANILGSGDAPLAIKYSRKCLKLVVFIGIAMGIIIASASGLAVSIYDVDVSVRHMAQKILLVIAVGQIFKTYNYTTIVGILRPGGDTRFCLILDGLSVWLIGVPMAFLGAAVLKFPIFVVVGMVMIEEVFKCIVSTYRVLSNKWAETLV